MTLLAVLLLAQAPAVWMTSPDSATVGDTVYLTRTLPAPPGARVRAQPLPRTAAAEPLADPVAEQSGSLLTLRYAVALFEPGPQALPMPMVEVVYSDGTRETILGDTAHVRIRSVLPPDDSLPEPRPSLSPLARPLRQAMPLGLLVGGVVGGAAAWAWARRRVRPRPRLPAAGLEPPRPPLERWTEAGELRAVATAAAGELRRVLSWIEPAASEAMATPEYVAALRRRADWPLDEIAEVLQALERARFAPAVPTDVLALAEQAATLAQRIQTAARSPQSAIH